MKDVSKYKLIVVIHGGVQLGFSQSEVGRVLEKKPIDSNLVRWMRYNGGWPSFAVVWSTLQEIVASSQQHVISVRSDYSVESNQLINKRYI